MYEILKEMQILFEDWNNISLSFFCFICN